MAGADDWGADGADDWGADGADDWGAGGKDSWGVDKTDDWGADGTDDWGAGGLAVPSGKYVSRSQEEEHSDISDRNGSLHVASVQVITSISMRPNRKISVFQLTGLKILGRVG